MLSLSLARRHTGQNNYAITEEISLLMSETLPAVETFIIMLWVVTLCNHLGWYCGFEIMCSFISVSNNEELYAWYS